MKVNLEDSLKAAEQQQRLKGKEAVKEFEQLLLFSIKCRETGLSYRR